MIRRPRPTEIKLLPQIENGALMKLRDGTAWLDRLSVLDRWQRRGYGAALIDRTAAAVRALGFGTLYLSTYRDVPWNAPFYERQGFEEVPCRMWPHAFRTQFMAENRHGHPPWRRTIMRRSVLHAGVPARKRTSGISRLMP
jgi:N-acetylglutamate synthase-like GNAT family acetyltransferase